MWLQLLPLKHSEILTSSFFPEWQCQLAGESLPLVDLADLHMRDV
jgi:hypothetical protein